MAFDMPLNKPKLKPKNETHEMGFEDKNGSSNLTYVTRSNSN